MDSEKSYVEENFHVLKELANLPPSKRRFILSKSGPDLISAFAKIFWNLMNNSDKNNLSDLKTVKLIKKFYPEIGTLIHHSSSIKKKREIILSNVNLQKLALNVGLSGYLYYRKENSNKHGTAT